MQILVGNEIVLNARLIWFREKIHKVERRLVNKIRRDDVAVSRNRCVVCNTTSECRSGLSSRGAGQWIVNDRIGSVPDIISINDQLRKVAASHLKRRYRICSWLSHVVVLTLERKQEEGPFLYDRTIHCKPISIILAVRARLTNAIIKKVIRCSVFVSIKPVPYTVELIGAGL